MLGVMTQLRLVAQTLSVAWEVNGRTDDTHVSGRRREKRHKGETPQEGN